MMLEGLNIIEFSEQFTTDDAYRKFLSSITRKNSYCRGKWFTVSVMK